MSDQVTVLFGLIIFGICMVMAWLESAHYNHGNVATWCLAIAAGAGAGISVARLVMMREYYLLFVFIMFALGCINSYTRASKLMRTKEPQLQAESEKTPSAS